ncbi:hypothetical protein [Halapricum desulfuricans]|uniref:Rhomboid family intramembrane serine protease n=1 Tax=Halapricum desulfuricans TaxID=2841257 RepID=A0A897N4G0_9EURY|nr:hypothetical protein [Halapricum desulfuricans]QSG06143.1 Uncharacterized protein HSR121_1809 [Halapricum desulfuricans]
MNSPPLAPWRSIRERLSLADALLLGIAPAVLIGVYALPAATREALVFRYADPTIRTAIAAPFVHLKALHLLFNLIAYGLIVGTIYALSAASGHREEFRIVFVSLLLVTPPVLSYLNLTIVRLGITYGFSGVLMAVYGYLPLSIAEYLESRLRVGRSRTLAPLFFFAGLAFMTVQLFRAVLRNPVTVAVNGVPASVSWVLAAALVELLVALLLVLSLYAISVANEAWDPRDRLGDAVRQTGYFEFGIVATLLFLAVPFATFPSDPIVGSRVFNLYVHFVGYTLGFISSYVYHVFS